MKRKRQKLILRALKCGFYKCKKDGTIYSVFKQGRQPKIKKFIKRNGSVGRNGYRLTSIRVSRGRSLVVGFHQIIYLYFNGPYSEYFQINHKDGDKLNNRFLNLEAISPYENNRHAKILGLRNHCIGERHPKATLTKTQVMRIFKIYNQRKNTLTELAVRFNTNPSTIYNIGNRISWRSATDRIL